MTVVYRTSGTWGAGKSADLTAAEVDGNFHDHELRITELEENPPSAVSIASIDVIGNQMTIHLTDSRSLGPFTIPTSQWQWKGEWAPSTIYFANDVITHGGSVYLVLTSHTSEASFDPAAENQDGFFYNLLIEPPEQPYDIGMYYGDTIPDDGRVILQHCATRDFIIAAAFGISTAFLENAVTEGDLVLDIFKNDAQIGTLTFAVGENLESPGDGQFGTFAQLSPPGDMEFTRTDRLTIRAPVTPDTMPAGLSVTIAARTPSIAP